MLDCLHSMTWPNDINPGASREIGKENFRWFNAKMSRHYDEELGDIAIMVDEGGGSRGGRIHQLRGTYLATDEGLPPKPMASAYFAARGDLFCRNR